MHRQISQLLDDASLIKRQTSPVSLQAMDAAPHERERKISVTHAPVAAPSADDMEPQNISFIGNSNNEDLALTESKWDVLIWIWFCGLYYGDFQV